MWGVFLAFVPAEVGSLQCDCPLQETFVPWWEGCLPGWQIPRSQGIWAHWSMVFIVSMFQPSWSEGKCVYSCSSGKLSSPLWMPYRRKYLPLSPYFNHTLSPPSPVSCLQVWPSRAAVNIYNVVGQHINYIFSSITWTLVSTIGQAPKTLHFPYLNVIFH